MEFAGRELQRNGNTTYGSSENGGTEENNGAGICGTAAEKINATVSKGAVIEAAVTVNATVNNATGGPISMAWVNNVSVSDVSISSNVPLNNTESNVSVIGSNTLLPNRNSFSPSSNNLLPHRNSLLPNSDPVYTSPITITNSPISFKTVLSPLSLPQTPSCGSTTDSVCSTDSVCDSDSVFDELDLELDGIGEERSEGSEDWEFQSLDSSDRASMHEAALFCNDGELVADNLTDALTDMVADAESTVSDSPVSESSFGFPTQGNASGGDGSAEGISQNVKEGIVSAECFLSVSDAAQMISGSSIASAQMIGNDARAESSICPSFRTCGGLTASTSFGVSSGSSSSESLVSGGSSSSDSLGSGGSSSSESLGGDGSSSSDSLGSELNICEIEVGATCSLAGEDSDSDEYDAYTEVNFISCDSIGSFGSIGSAESAQSDSSDQDQNHCDPLGHGHSALEKADSEKEIMEKQLQNLKEKLMAVISSFDVCDVAAVSEDVAGSEEVAGSGEVTMSEGNASEMAEPKKTAEPELASSSVSGNNDVKKNQDNQDHDNPSQDNPRSDELDSLQHARDELDSLQHALKMIERYEVLIFCVDKLRQTEGHLYKYTDELYRIGNGVSGLKDWCLKHEIKEKEWRFEKGVEEVEQVLEEEKQFNDDKDALEQEKQSDEQETLEEGEEILHERSSVTQAFQSKFELNQENGNESEVEETEKNKDSPPQDEKNKDSQKTHPETCESSQQGNNNQVKVLDASIDTSTIDTNNRLLRTSIRTTLQQLLEPLSVDVNELCVVQNAQIAERRRVIEEHKSQIAESMELESIRREMLKRRAIKKQWEEYVESQIQKKRFERASQRAAKVASQKVERASRQGAGDLQAAGGVEEVRSSSMASSPIASSSMASSSTTSSSSLTIPVNEVQEAETEERTQTFCTVITNTGFSRTKLPLGLCNEVLTPRNNSDGKDGARNTGSSYHSGPRNTGDGNNGPRNAGDGNSGSRNSGSDGSNGPRSSSDGNNGRKCIVHGKHVVVKC